MENKFKLSYEKELPKRFHLNGHTIGFYLSTDLKVRTTLHVSVIPEVKRLTLLHILRCWRY